MKNSLLFRRVNEAVGVLLLLGLTCALVGGLVATKWSEWNRPERTLKVTLPPDGSFGLQEGAEVHVLGTTVGHVNEISVKDATMEATIRVREDFTQFIGPDSVVTIKKSFVIAGDAYLEISRGSEPGTGRIEPLVARPGEDPLETFRTMVTNVGEKLVPAVEQFGEGATAWKTLAQDLADSNKQLNAALVDLGQMVSDVKEGKGSLGDLIVKPTLAEDLHQLLGDIQESVKSAHSAIQKIEAASAKLPKIAAAVEDEIEELPGLAQQTTRTLHEAERLIDGLQRHWLIRSYVEPAKEERRVPASRTIGFERGEP